MSRREGIVSENKEFVFSVPDIKKRRVAAHLTDCSEAIIELCDSHEHIRALCFLYKEESEQLRARVDEVEVALRCAKALIETYNLKQIDLPITVTAISKIEAALEKGRK